MPRKCKKQKPERFELISIRTLSTSGGSSEADAVSAAGRTDIHHWHSCCHGQRIPTPTPPMVESVFSASGKHWMHVEGDAQEMCFPLYVQLFSFISVILWAVGLCVSQKSRLAFVFLTNSWISIWFPITKCKCCDLLFTKCYRTPDVVTVLKSTLSKRRGRAPQPSIT